MRVTFERAPPVPIHDALRSPHCAPVQLCERSVPVRWGFPRTEIGRPSHLMSISPTVDKDTALAQARAAIENRTKYIESLFDAAQASADAREKVAEATRSAERANTEHAAAYKEAIEAGWTAAELTALPLPAPAPVSKKPSKTSKRATGRGTPRRRVGAENTTGPDRRPDDASSTAPGTPSEPQPSPADAH